MKRSLHHNQDAMLSRLFFRLLPVQVAIVAMGYINTIVDGIVAARFIDADTVGVVGLYYTMLRVLEAAGAILLGGVAVLSGRYLGSGRIDKTRGICSLGTTVALLFGVFLTAASFVAPGAIADVLGANERFRSALSVYVKGYAYGIVPQLVGQQLAASLQLERQEKLGHLSIIVMIVVNVALDILFVAVWRMGVWGLALSTSIANWAYFLVVIQYYFTKKAQLKPTLRLIDWRELLPVVRIGFPNALLVACLAARSMVINRLLLKYAGSDGLAALSSFNMVCGLLLCVSLGTGALIRMLASVLIGEENREGLLSLMKLVSSKVMALILGVTAAVFLLAPALAMIFFPDTGSEVYRMTRQLFTVYGFCVPLTLMCIAYSSYCQAAGHRLLTNMVSLTDGFFSMVIPALLLAPRLGAMGVWLSLPIGLVITLGVSVVHAVVRNGHWPRNLEEWLMLPADFGTSERLVLTLRSMEDVTRTSARVQAFCDGHGIDRKTGFHAGLCLEEIAGNIVRHGFSADHMRHEIEVRVVLKKADVMLRIKDDCIAFNPQEWVEMAAGSDPLANVGIRLVYRLAEDVSYQNLLGLNVLTISVNDCRGHLLDVPDPRNRSLCSPVR